MGRPKGSSDEFFLSLSLSLSHTLHKLRASNEGLNYSLPLVNRLDVLDLLHLDLHGESSAREAKSHSSSVLGDDLERAKRKGESAKS